MPRSAVSDRTIESLVAEFTDRLTQVVRRSALEQVLAALGGATPPARRGPGRPKGSRNKPRPARAAKAATKGGKRTPEALEKLGASLLAYVKAHPGQRGEQIAAALKTDVGTMRLPMQKLVAAKKVRTEGQRRGTTYFAGAGGKRRAKAAKRKRVARKPRRKSRSRRPARAARRGAKGVRPTGRGVLIPRPRPTPVAKPRVPVPSQSGTARLVEAVIQPASVVSS